MPQPIWLVCAVPGSGKTWTCNQLQDKFAYVPHDPHSIGKPADNYLRVLVQAARHAQKPVLGEAPFKISILIEALRRQGMIVKPVFILESPDTVKKRYEARERKPIPQVHLSRITTVQQRARQLGIFSGRAEDVLAYLQKLAV